MFMLMEMDRSLRLCWEMAMTEPGCAHKLRNMTRDSYELVAYLLGLGLSSRE